jgi:hypothetical protein
MNELTNEWWGDFTIETGASAQWEIGPLRIAVQRMPHEWLVAHEQIETTDDQQEWRFAYSDLDLNESNFAQTSRFVYQNTPEKITVLPALADRSVVSRPFTPFTVPADENATIYVTSPLWFTLATGLPLQKLFETPIQRPSDTWFGSSTLEGETCYASRTYGRLNLENLTIYPHRAITQVHIHNNSTDPLLVERLNLPVPYLSLFHTPEGTLRTETVTVVQTRGTSLAEFNIEKEPPPSTSGAKLIAAPRKDPQKGMLIRAFSVLKLQGFD